MNQRANELIIGGLGDALVQLRQGSGACHMEGCKVKGGGLLRIEGIWDYPIQVCAVHLRDMLRVAVVLEARNRSEDRETAR